MPLPLSLADALPGSPDLSCAMKTPSEPAAERSLNRKPEAVERDLLQHGVGNGADETFHDRYVGDHGRVVSIAAGLPKRAQRGRCRVRSGDVLLDVAARMVRRAFRRADARGPTARRLQHEAARRAVAVRAVPPQVARGDGHFSGHQESPRGDQFRPVGGARATSRSTPGTRRSQRRRPAIRLY